MCYEKLTLSYIFSSGSGCELTVDITYGDSAIITNAAIFSFYLFLKIQ